MKAGFDFGAKNLSAAVLDENGVVFDASLPHNGNIEAAFARMLDRIRERLDFQDIRTFGLTGNISVNGMRTFDPVIASVEANHYLETGGRNIFSIGCESFYLIRLDARLNYSDHIVNSDCASGTGGFIDQQAERLGFTTEELSRRAADYEDTPPSIATRCAVFAKSDIIHAQARGFSKDAICAGLCEGVARNVLANTVRGGDLPGSVLFTGGMSLNRKVLARISEVLGKPVIVPDHALTFNAVGAAVLGQEPADRLAGISRASRHPVASRPPLEMGLVDYPDFGRDEAMEEDGIEITRYAPLDRPACRVYIGIDVGSTSTKALVMTQAGEILAGLYGRTKGDPVGAATALLGKMNHMFAGLTILGVATTGSGRELIRQIIGADSAINEITAHALGATFIDPDTDTIIEIGGQDSKFTQLSQGQVTNSVMNYVCAAGTGSFIEEQAKRLDITLDEISEMAKNRTAPFTSDRCTVYMERDLNTFLAGGWKREQIITAVLYSVRDNYLSKVVGKSRMGNRIYFQGATARNKALVAVFETELGRPVHVSRYCHLTGALGAAVSLMQQGVEKTRFSGMDIRCQTHTEICDLCANRCELRVYTTGGTQTAWGLKCGRDYADKTAKKTGRRSAIERRFRQIFAPSVPAPESPRLTVGIPDTLFMKEYLGLFTDFFHRLGMATVVEKGSDKKLARGMEMLNADFCAPMALSHGIADALAGKAIDFIFFPTLISEQHLIAPKPTEELFREKMTDAYFCYYSSYAPAIIDNLPAHPLQVPVVSPKIRFNNMDDAEVAQALAGQLAGVVDLSPGEIADAFIAARHAFYDARARWEAAGRKILDSARGRMKIMLLGRPYALFDPRINLGIPKRLEEMGFDLISQSMMPPEDGEIAHMAHMHWYFGQQILSAADLAARSVDIYPVFLTCFRCSPDAYLITYFKEIMEKAEKPYLVLQLDEHASDVGYMTRIEAAADAFVNDFEPDTRRQDPPQRQEQTAPGPDRFREGDTILIPATDDRINRFQKAVFEAAGYSARILDLNTAIMNRGYRFTSGGECLPNVAIVGSVLRVFDTSDLSPENTILYLPNICLSCNFNQYAELVRVACKNAGQGRVRTMNFNGLAAAPGISAKANALLLSAVILGSLLEKLKRRYQPYEIEKGQVAALVARAEEIVLTHIREKRSLLSAAKEIRKIFDTLPLPAERKPVIAVLGDLYAKFNTVLNGNICDEIEALGGEVLLPSYNELVLHAMHADVMEHGDDGRLLATMIRYEQRFEKIFEDMLDDRFEPDPDACDTLIKEFGLNNFIAGETYVSLGRLLYDIENGLCDAVVHVNPLLCCPGVISASIFKNIQHRFDIPVVDLFYDGTNQPNKMIEPLMFYLNKPRRCLP